MAEKPDEGARKLINIIAIYYYREYHHIGRVFSYNVLNELIDQMVYGLGRKFTWIIIRLLIMI